MSCLSGWNPPIGQTGQTGHLSVLSVSENRTDGRTLIECPVCPVRMSGLSCPAVEHVAGRSLFPSRSRGWLDQPNVIDPGNLARANQSIFASLFQCPLERLQFGLPLGFGVGSLCRVGRHELKADGVEGTALTVRSASSPGSLLP